MLFITTKRITGLEENRWKQGKTSFDAIIIIQIKAVDSKQTYKNKVAIQGLLPKRMWKYLFSHQNIRSITFYSWNKKILKYAKYGLDMEFYR